MYRNKIQDAVSTAASVTSDPVDISRGEIWAVSWKWTGTTNGALKVQRSPDGIVWGDVASATAAPAGSANEAIYNNATHDGCQFVRSVYTRTDGTGTLTTIFSVKESRV